ncbi:MAG: antitermination protein NusG [Planctomycetes bacterium]|nr:antitermination protein NusG [Planctomycetota bacterium]
MPILEREPDLHPEDLLEREELGEERNHGWWVFYTRSRREKEMMRKLLAMDVSFYGPLVPQERRSPSGRLRTTYLPLFANYVFVYGDASARVAALTTNCVSRSIEVGDGAGLSRDLGQIRRLIESGAVLTPERQMETGVRVRVRTGAFQGLEGVVIKRQGKTRLLVSVDFLQQGASLTLGDCDVERVNWSTCCTNRVS